MDFIRAGWSVFDSMLERYIGEYEPSRYPGDGEVCRLLSLLCMENDIPVRFYHHRAKDRVEVNLIDTSREVDWVLLFDLFTDEYPSILKPEPKADVKSEFYQTIEDGL